MPQYGFFIDLSRCIGCNSCTIACKQWHDIEPGPAKPLRVYQWENGGIPELKLHMLPVMCYHCEQPVCVDACENKSIYKEEKYGAVLVDTEKCRGNRDCWRACPYGTPQYANDDPDTKMLKCDMCIERLEQGLKPICILSCSMRALEFAPLPEIIQKYGYTRRLYAKPGYAPCRLACPAGCNAEEYKRYIAEGKFKEALESFRDFSPFAGVLGRICTHPCEDECQRGLIENPLPIRTLKRFMADVEMKAGGSQLHGCLIANKKRVAIVGSGPAGLSCAYDLIKKGYPVTVFEAAPKSGGMLRYGIPNYRLPKEVLDHEIGYIQALGVEIKTGKEVKEISSLFSEGYEAVFLATGASLPRTLPSVTGTVEGGLFGIDFLRDVNSGKEFRLGERVIVVGGGSVAIDAARVAWRLGAEEVQIVCLESRNLRSPERMPAQESEILEAEEEGIIINPSLGIKGVLVDNGRLKGIETVTCSSVFDDQGNFAPIYTTELVREIPGDTLIVAIGQTPNPSNFKEIEKKASGEIKTDPITLETSIQGVFAGGDAVTGAADAITAVSTGKTAALSIDLYIRGEDIKKRRAPPIEKKSAGSMRDRTARTPQLALEERRSFKEVILPLPEAEAIEHANRCFRCGTTMPCVVFKSVDAKEMVIQWDPIRALELWQKRQPCKDEPLPDVFSTIADVLYASREIVGRNKLVLKAENSEELLYYTTDNE